MTDPREPMRPWPLLFLIVYALHLLDEGLVAGGLPGWAMEHGYHFTVHHWLTVSLVSFCLFSTAIWLVARRTWPDWVLVALAVHITLHALAHLGSSLWFASLSPGALSGLFLSLPLAGWTFWWAAHVIERTILVRALILGALTFQAIWDFLVRLVFGLPFTSV